jgi:D-alanine-D-alanine ligase
MKNLLLLFGGGSSEHKISQITCDFLEEQIDKKEFNIFKVEMISENQWLYCEEEVSLNFDRSLRTRSECIATIDLALPCIHGYPAETGDIQSFFKLIKLPFFGVGSEASKICFNKVLTKTWLEKAGFTTAPFLFLGDASEQSLAKAEEFRKNYNHVFIKASNQGSSIGCYSAKTYTELEDSLKQAFKFSQYVLIESFIKGRELEVSVFEFKNQLHATPPGEIVCPVDFYNFEQKYDKSSKTQIHVMAPNITDETSNTLKRLAKEIFKNFNLKDLCRVDFFLKEDGTIFINEINTFPGMTPISLFPQMMELSGTKFYDFINDRLLNTQI